MHGDEAGRGREAIEERIDKQIDAALRSYAEPGEVPEARVVLARVMERAREWESRRRGRWIWGAMATAGLAVVVLVGVIWMFRGPRSVEIAGVPKAPAVAGKIAPASGGVRRGAPARERSAGSRMMPVHANLRPDSEPLPKKDEFPGSRPLSAEEQALVAFANDVPAKTQEQVIEAQQHAANPIAIAELKIAPLEIGGEEQDSNQQKKNKER